MIISSLIFVNDLDNKSIGIGRLELNLAAIATSAITSFASCYLFVVVSFNADGFTNNEKFSYKYYTAKQPFSVLSFTESKFTDEFEEKILKSSNSNVYTNTPAFEALKKFTTETGNNEYIKNSSKASISVSINEHGKTRISHGNIEIHSKNKRVFRGDDIKSQSREEYKKSQVELGEDSSNGFTYATTLLPFQTGIDSAKWTSFIDGHRNINRNVGQILQYPKLSEIINVGRRDKNVTYWKENLEHDKWIRNIASSNPDNRGFLGFIYRYVSDLSDNILPPGCDESSSELVSRATSAPYIRFVDIVNNQKVDIKINAVSYKVIGNLNNLYKLRDISNRRDLFKKEFARSYPLGEGFRISPGEHFLIPIEFGFDTKAQRSAFSTTSPTNRSTLLQLAGKNIYVSKIDVLTKKNDERNAKNLTQQMNFSTTFINQTRQSEELQELIPKRFSVGPIIDLESLKVDDKVIKLKIPPQDDPSLIQLSLYYGSGSCPYISIKQKESASWQDLGTILFGRSNHALKDTEIRYLGDNITDIYIEEREKEITFIDYLSVIYFDSALQQDKEIFPQISKSTEKIDGDYYSLKQGENIKINVENILPQSASKIRIKVNGYYLPLEGKDFPFPKNILIRSENNQP